MLLLSITPLVAAFLLCPAAIRSSGARTGPAVLQESSHDIASTGRATQPHPDVTPAAKGIKDLLDAKSSLRVVELATDLRNAEALHEKRFATLDIQVRALEHQLKNAAKELKNVKKHVRAESEQRRTAEKHLWNAQEDLRLAEEKLAMYTQPLPVDLASRGLNMAAGAFSSILYALDNAAELPAYGLDKAADLFVRVLRPVDATYTAVRARS